MYGVTDIFVTSASNNVIVGAVGEIFLLHQGIDTMGAASGSQYMTMSINVKTTFPSPDRKVYLLRISSSLFAKVCTLIEDRIVG